MLPVYATCKKIRGSGCFVIIKKEMAEFLNKNKDNIFKGAQETLLSEFNNIQVSYSILVFRTLFLMNPSCVIFILPISK